ncbi:vanadium-dependent haloperoxidase [Terrimonas alba]|uniref:vanadium-dependent haloperoxidase n=1 Tax=Terrimonas alba TaxID=3349636 RepID=UPI0035F4839E
MKSIFHSIILIALVSMSCKKNDSFIHSDQQDSRLITDWINLQLQLIRSTTGVTHVAFSRHFSYTGVALYETLASGDSKYRSIATHLNGSPQLPVLNKGNKVFYPASANAAIAAMLRFFYNKPAGIASIDSLERIYETKFELAIKSKTDLDAAIAYGKQMASAVIEWSKLDGAADAAIAYTPLGEGYWEPTPPALAAANVPGWKNNRTFFAGSTEGTMPIAPLSFSKEAGSPFYAMAKELYDVSQALTDEQKAIANFWDDAPNGKYVTVFGHWFNILRQVLLKEKTKLMDAAEAYLLLGITMNDATISCWKAKYNYHQLRPITYIRKYMGHPEWNSFITTPPHPEYSAAHATISSSAAFALESVFGKNYSFTDHTYDAIGMSPRTFASFDAAGKEAGIFRVYGGIHFKLSTETGNVQGKKVGQNVFSLLHTK